MTAITPATNICQPLLNENRCSRTGNHSCRHNEHTHQFTGCFTNKPGTSRLFVIITYPNEKKKKSFAQTTRSAARELIAFPAFSANEDSTRLNLMKPACE